MNEYLDLMVNLRRDLHQIPEISFDLFKTSEYVKTKLIEFGYEPIKVAKTGFIAVKEGKSKEAIAFRSDMDALRVTEKTEVTYESNHPGQMHACGHDGHMAMLLGLAKYLSTIEVNKTVVLVFQPAEEGPGGAKLIIEEGLFTKYQIKAIFAFHLYPDIKEGLIGIAEGPLLAQSGEYVITVNGKSSHGAMPHQGHDAIFAASQVINNYHHIISRMIDPLQPAVLSVGLIKGGEARNIIPKTVSFEGTIRAFDESVYEDIKVKMREINDSIAKMLNVNIDASFYDFYPPVVNNHNLHEDIKHILKQDEYVISKPVMISEDFAYYQKQVPGYFMFLGTRNEKEGYIYPLHNCRFNFNENVLLKGLETYLKICKYYEVL